MRSSRIIHSTNMRRNWRRLPPNLAIICRISSQSEPGLLAGDFVSCLVATGSHFCLRLSALLWDSGCVRVALGGIIAVCTRNFVNFELGFGPVIGSFMGSFVVSLIAVKAVHWFDVPNHVLTIPSVIPMIPGVLMYRSLLAFINLHGVIGEVTNAFSNGINSALIILCISLGVAVPNIFARRYIAKDRQRYLQDELEKRRQRGKFLEW